MKFAAVIEYTPDKAKIAEIRPAHRKYLIGLYDASKLAIAGPFGDDSGAVIVYEATTPEEAEGFLRNDPFCTNGVFIRWNLRPWKTVFVGKMDPVKPT
jgi:uncharacterized protein YciI